MISESTMYAALRRQRAATGAAARRLIGRPSAADRKHLDAGQVRGPGTADFRVPVVSRAPHGPNPGLQLLIVGARSERGPQVRPARREEAGEPVSYTHLRAH